MKRLAALVPNLPGTAPGRRVRIESWVAFLERAGWAVELYPFEDPGFREVLYEPGRDEQPRPSRLVDCYRQQLQRVLALPPCDVVLVYREAALIGPAVLERLVGRRDVPTVFDLDEPIFLPYPSPTSGWASLLKVSRKTHSLFRLATEVMSINGLIGEYAARYNPAVTVVPNFVDVNRYVPAERRGEGAVWLAWSGSHSTMPNLRPILPALWRLQQDNRAPLRVVGSGTVDLPGIDLEVREWSAATEVRDIQDCDFGLVPLVDSRWNRWKLFVKGRSVHGRRPARRRSAHGLQPRGDRAWCQGVPRGHSAVSVAEDPRARSRSPASNGRGSPGDGRRPLLGGGQRRPSVERVRASSRREPDDTETVG